MAQDAVNVKGHRSQTKLFARWQPGPFFADEGVVYVWLEDSNRDIDTERFMMLVRWAEKNETPPLTVDSHQGLLQFTVGSFLEVLDALCGEQQQEWTLSDSAFLYARILRASWYVVEAGDILAFACPEELSIQEVFDTCFLFNESQDDVLPSWSTGTGKYRAAWIPAWSDARMRALRFMYMSLADVLWSPEWNADNQWLKRDHGQILTDAWFFQCCNHLMGRVVKDVSLGDNLSDRKTSYRVMYRGEEEVLSAWKEALCRPENSSFHADGWLVARTLRQAFQDSGWRRELLLDRTGRAYFRIEFELIPPHTDGLSPDWELCYEIVHQYFGHRAKLLEWWQMEKRKWRIGHDVLYEPDIWILPELRLAGQLYAPIAKTLESPLPWRCVISSDEVVDLVQNRLPLLREHGFTVRTPELDNSHVSNVRIRVQVQKSKQKSGMASTARSIHRFFNADQIVEFDWSLVVDDMELSRQEFERLVKERSSYIQLGGSWRLMPVEEILKQVQALGGNKQAPSASMMDFSRMLLMSEEDIDEESSVQVEVSYEDEAIDVEKVLRVLKAAHHPQLAETPHLFRGTLRQYQSIGYSWLLELRRIGCGACLADDMGLGKTIQVLAYLMRLKETGNAKGVHLLICPTSLLQNWKAEITRFVPELKLYVHHGSQRNTPLDNGRMPLEQALGQVDIVMTTYATAVRDIEWFQEQFWDVVIVDEAQNIKNPDTKQSLAVRSLHALHRIALTGTPIENRLEELWSIFRFTNPGYLGSLAWFRKHFAEPIAQNPQSNTAVKLQHLLRPVLLRRRKTEPSIQVELPEKWEVREYSALTAEQAALYQSIVNQLFTGIEQAGTMSRRGQILAALVRLKQVCDHPCLVVGGSSAVNRSGKLKLLLDLLEGVVEESESALVFTQFRDMGELLCDAIETYFGKRPKFLHGGLTASMRGQIVDEFQSGADPSGILVLSLKAGGVGLNLTRANHVFHFDRWWNPAVEDQATDRAYRIGQVRDVQVHKLVCSGTLEERIDALISSKRQLSQAIVGGSEGWVTELDDAQLQELFQLDVDSAFEEDE